MENPSHQSVVVSVPKTCLAASAGLHHRDGHTVVAHYGSVSAEIAVCKKSVGLADHSDYGVLELRGDRETLDRALIARFGDPPLTIGNGRRLHSVWYVRMDAHHTLLVGPHAAVRSEAATEYGRDRSLPYRDIRASLAIVGIVGPRATRLLSAAGLPGKPALTGADLLDVRRPTRGWAPRAGSRVRRGLRTARRPCTRTVQPLRRRLKAPCRPAARISRATRFSPTPMPSRASIACTRGLP